MDRKTQLVYFVLLLQRNVRSQLLLNNMVKYLRDFPLLIFVTSLVGLWLSAQAGVWFRKRLRPIEDEERKDLANLETATLGLLGLIIAFSFSMAIGRYDQRKNCEADEANAIGTEFARADLLPTPEAENVRTLLKDYLHQRVAFYEDRDAKDIQQIGVVTDNIERQLWSSIDGAAAKQPTPPVALAAAGMNSVFDDRAYTQAAWWNRIPVAAWDLMISIAILCNFLVGYSAYRNNAHLFIVLPLALSIAFLLISDLDSPRGGIIRVTPQNLTSLAETLQSR